MSDTRILKYSHHYFVPNSELTLLQTLYAIRKQKSNDFKTKTKIENTLSKRTVKKMMTVIEIMHGKTQNEYDRLLSNLAHEIRTHRRLITLLGAERIDDKTTRYFVKRKGVYYPYVIEETCVGSNYRCKNIGIKI